MILISSAAYIEQDLAFEVGRLPPAFLPIGNKRLYEHQFDFLKSLQLPIYLSVPESFSVSEFDNSRLAELGISLIVVPDGLTLGNSILYSWSATGELFHTLSILHGDTLFIDTDCFVGDCVSAHHNTGAYSRAKVTLNSPALNHYQNEFVEDDQQVLSGFFSFSKPQLLMQGILQSKGDFIGGIEHYDKKCKLTEVNNGQWLDFGHLNSFFRSRSLMTTQRAFNDLKIEPRRVIKASQDKTKMLAESNWFKSLPRELSMHTPALLADYSDTGNRATYTLEYLYLLPLNDLLVFGKLSDAYWQHIFTAAYEIIMQFSQYVPAAFNLSKANDIYLPKTLERVTKLQTMQLCNIRIAHDFFHAEKLIKMAKDSAMFISPVSATHIGIIHGDYCFSNILFDSRTQALKLIDPRGVDSAGLITIFGDQRYDVAKFYHSVVGCYDFIIAGRYKIDGNEILFYEQERLNRISSIFDKIFFESGAFNKVEILAINVQLFISMLPLHADRPDRQLAMLLNAQRMYHQLCELIK